MHRKTLIPSAGEAGCDEAGRGALAGPVVAAAVVLPEGYSHPALDDSKKLSATRRQELRCLIEQQALSFGIGVADVDEINRLNIWKATLLAMHRALAALATPVAWILVDGNRFAPFGNVPHRCIIRGDATHTSVAAASVLAKTYRDALMIQLHEQFPEYNWKQNKGYGTREHALRIACYGSCAQHRSLFVRRMVSDAGKQQRMAWP
ncbi:MAG: ribonuclease HII [Chitinophagales bacterium]|nr:ribonuclease HII [Chitinophagales bacterium]MDW8393992.1 ribonuclease HII [Chitinophagales bacterium]